MLGFLSFFRVIKLPIIFFFQYFDQIVGHFIVRAFDSELFSHADQGSGEHIDFCVTVCVQILQGGITLGRFSFSGFKFFLERNPFGICDQNDLVAHLPHDSIHIGAVIVSLHANAKDCLGKVAGNI